MQAPSDRLRRVGDILIVCAAGALVAGALQAILFEWRLRVLGQIAWPEGGVPVGRDLIWMSPLSFLFFLAFPALLLVGVSLARRRPLPLALPVGVFGSLAALGFLLLIGEIHQLPAMLLAVGIGVQLARMTARDETRARRLIRRGAAALAVGFVALAATTRGARAMAERRAVAALRDAPASAPNVLIIILDTVRASAMSLYGYERATTPALDRLAASSVVFDRAFSTTSWTLPSHGSMFTGRRAGELSTRWNAPLDDRDRTLAEALAAHGYLTAGFVANPFYTTHETGLGRGFHRYEDVPVSLRQLLVSSSFAQTPFVKRLFRNPSREGLLRSLRELDFRLTIKPEYDRKDSRRLTSEFLDWQRRVAGRPFFAMLNLYDAHRPYNAPDGFDSLFARDPGLRDSYDGAIAYMDRELARMLAALERRGVLDNTILIVTSDHGEHFGEWGLQEHGNSLYRPSLHVPLLIRAPRRAPGGVRIHTAVSLRDLPRTVAHLAGLDTDPAFPGSSLAGTWTPGAPPPSLVVAEFEGGHSPETPEEAMTLVSVIDDSTQYIVRDDDREELYDLRRPEGDTFNLAADTARQALLARLRERAKRLKNDRQPPVLAGH